MGKYPDPTGEPCAECPWRRDAAAGHLGPYDAAKWIEIVQSDSPIACHLTISPDDVDAMGIGSWDQPGMRQCRGAAIFRANICKSPRDPDVATGPRDTETVFPWPADFIAHHGAGPVWWRGKMLPGDVVAFDRGNMDVGMTSRAWFSDDRDHRYLLVRDWDKSKETLQVIGLNPSTADHHRDDPTVRVLVNVAKANGYGSIAITNLFSYRATDPKDCRDAAEERNRDRRNSLDFLARYEGGDVLMCWGAQPWARERGEAVMKAIEAQNRRALAVGLVRNGQPRHVLMARTKGVELKTLGDLRWEARRADSAG